VHISLDTYIMGFKALIRLSGTFFNTKLADPSIFASLKLYFSTRKESMVSIQH
jgi:hypothetical protein